MKSPKRESWELNSKLISAMVMKAQSPRMPEWKVQQEYSLLTNSLMLLTWFQSTMLSELMRVSSSQISWSFARRQPMTGKLSLCPHCREPSNEAFSQLSSNWYQSVRKSRSWQLSASYANNLRVSHSVQLVTKYKTWLAVQTCTCHFAGSVMGVNRVLINTLLMKVIPLWPVSRLKKKSLNMTSATLNRSKL